MLQTELSITAAGAELPADLTIPDAATGVVVFAHGSGSGRRSPRNTLVAGRLREAGFGTLLFDLLSAEEARVDEANMAYRFDVPLLGNRLVGAVEWLARHDEAAGLAVGLFGASTGAAAALVAAARLPEPIRAVVSRGGRPDLAGPLLGAVRAPVLLIVGGEDRQVLTLNREAREEMTGARCELQQVPGAGHLFEEPGALDQVVDLTVDWFTEHLRPVTRG